MEQTNIFAIYLLGKWLDNVFVSARVAVRQNVAAWQQAVSLLDWLIAPGPQYRNAFTLSLSAGAAITLRQHINKGVEQYQTNQDVVMDDAWVTAFNTAF